MYLISDNIDTLTGMRLAGVDGIVVHEREELRCAIENAMEDKDVGVILLTEKFGREFPDLIDEIKLERTMPLLIEIPDRHGTGRKKDFITSYVNYRQEEGGTFDKRREDHAYPDGGDGRSKSGGECDRKAA